MMLIIYGKKNCSRCLNIKNFLKQKNIPYGYIENEEKLRLIGSKYRIMSAPIIEFNDKFYSMENFLKELKRS